MTYNDANRFGHYSKGYFIFVGFNGIIYPHLQLPGQKRGYGLFFEFTICFHGSIL